MKNIIFVGPQQAGKSTITHILEQTGKEAQKTVVPEYHENILDTPGEFMEHPSFFGSFITLAAEYRMVGLVVPCNFQYAYIPPNFTSMFINKICIGIISKTDIGTKEDIKRCKKLLQDSGIQEIYEVSMHDKKSIQALRKAINNYAEAKEAYSEK